MNKTIPRQANSGKKYLNDNGIVAIKDGIKAQVIDSQADVLKKPNWFKVAFPDGDNYTGLKSMVNDHHLSTVCEESKCPNIGECWNNRTATLMVLGNICTRACRFCAVDTGNPKGWIDPKEPENIAKTVKYMNLGYVVITSVDRDDLDDGGASHISDCVFATKAISPKTKVEVLSPDFQGQTENLDILLDSDIDVFSQNLETVESLTALVRDPRAGYNQTLQVLEYTRNKGFITKSGMMLGLGETYREVEQAMVDLYNSGIEILTLGQYLSPTKNHLPVKEYISPERFQEYEYLGHQIGLKEVVAGPLIRSSYRADQAYKRLNGDSND